MLTVKSPHEQSNRIVYQRDSRSGRQLVAASSSLSRSFCHFADDLSLASSISSTEASTPSSCSGATAVLLHLELCPMPRRQRAQQKLESSACAKSHSSVVHLCSAVIVSAAVGCSLGVGCSTVDSVSPGEKASQICCSKLISVYIERDNYAHCRCKHTAVVTEQMYRCSRNEAHYSRSMPSYLAG